MVRTSASWVKVSLFAGACFFLGIVNTALASTGLTIQPVKISHTMYPGEEISGVVSLKNASDDEKIEVDAKVEDFTPVAGGSTVQFIGRAPGVTTVRDWITLDIPENFIFEKGDSISVPYTIRAPKDAEPGGHYGVLLFKASKTGDESMLKVGTQVGILMFITIPGSHLQKGKILEFTAPKFSQKPPIQFTVKFENTGTVHFEPKGKITITNMFGRKAGEILIEGQVVLPTGIRDLIEFWNTNGLLLGKYTADVSLKDGEGNGMTTQSVSFWVIPVWYLLEFLGGLILTYIALRYVKRKVKISIVHD